MPLYLARGPATTAFLIRARDRDHLNYILDEEQDPGAYEIEVYEGPLVLRLSIPASLEGEFDFASAIPDVRARFDGKTAVGELWSLPALEALNVVEDEWAHLRRCAFPRFGAALDELLEQAVDEDAQVSKAALERAIVDDVVRQGRLALWRTERVDGDERERREQLMVTVSPESLAAGRATHAQWKATEWEANIDEGAEDERTADMRLHMAEAVDRFGEVSFVITAEGERWRLGNPAVAEGSTLAEALAKAGA